MLVDVSPLRHHRDFRYLYFGQLISFFGTMITYVALPYQIYHLTKSSFSVGIVGVVELVPLLLTAFIGGVLADSMDRRKLLLGSEMALMVCSLLLGVNSFLPRPYIWPIYGIAAMMSALNGFHRPALDSLTLKLVSRDHIHAVSPLMSMKASLGMIGGPALGGICIATLGLPSTYSLDFLSFMISLFFLSRIKSLPPAEKVPPMSFQRVFEGIHYARSRQELIGTYLIDFIAMVFSMPTALFPAVSESLGGARAIGWLYSAPALGALLASLFSGWTKKVTRHGMAVIVAASLWGLSVSAFGFAQRIEWALFFLVLAGAADMTSGIFRTTIWNQTIPDRIRGRMAGVEMIGYSSGPLLGNAEAGLFASLAGTHAAIVSGGLLCVFGVAVCSFFLPKFRRYDSSERRVDSFEGVPHHSTAILIGED